MEDNQLDLRHQKIEELKQTNAAVGRQLVSLEESLLKREERSQNKLDQLSTLLTRLSTLKKKSSSRKRSSKMLLIHEKINSTMEEEQVLSMRLKDQLHAAIELCSVILGETLTELEKLIQEIRRDWRGPEPVPTFFLGKKKVNS